jgi:hypothetical protein
MRKIAVLVLLAMALYILSGCAFLIPFARTSVSVSDTPVAEQPRPPSSQTQAALPVPTTTTTLPPKVTPESDPIQSTTPEQSPEVSPKPSSGAENVVIFDDIGMVVTYPKEWSVYDETEVKKLYINIIDYIKSLYKDPELVDKAIEDSVPRSMAMKHPYGYLKRFNSNVGIQVKSIPAYFEQMDIIEFTKLAIEEAAKQYNGKLD